MNNVTYLLGAGASKNSLPIVSDFPNRISSCLNLVCAPEFELSNEEAYPKLDIPYTKKQVQQEFIAALKWMRDECINHTSVDTYAKKLYLRGELSKLNKLKATLACFLTIEEIRNRFDIRYDSFFASILQDSIESLPSNIRIISWNYDSQFELAYRGYTDMNKMSENQRLLNVTSKYSGKYNFEPDKFGIYKVNGMAGMNSKSDFGVINLNEDMKSIMDKEALDSLLKQFAILSISQSKSNAISFAWEKDEAYEMSIIDKTVIATQNTEVLIVIGYSFPFFNRDVDRKLIGSMDKLKKVYFQDPDPDSVEETFRGIREGVKASENEFRYKTEKFLLPKEL